MNLMDTGNFGVIWKELGRRKVFRVALVYVLMAWGVMQVGELLFEALQVPESAYTLLVILVLLGFPVAVVLAWAYEITPEGVRRDIVQELRKERLRYSPLGQQGGEESHHNARLAILPFRDMAPDHDLEYFCEGMAEEIQNALCAVPGLEVIARAHSVQYGGKKIDIDEIERNLRVNAIIEGSVRRSGDVYRISVQLVDIMNGTDIWSRSFDKPMGGDFAIQKDVAVEIARHTKLTFSKLRGKDSVEATQLTLDTF